MSRRPGRPEDTAATGPAPGGRPSAPETGATPMMDALEARVDALLGAHAALEARLAARERELAQLRGDLERHGRERAEMRARLDALLAEVDAAMLAVGDGA